MHLVPDRRKLDLQMRIVREDRPARLRLAAGQHPVVAVASTRARRQPLEAGGQARVRAFCQLRCPPIIPAAVENIGGRAPSSQTIAGAVAGYRAGQFTRRSASPNFAASGAAHQLRLVILREPPRQQPPDRERIDRLPRRRRDAEHLEFDRPHPADQCRPTPRSRRPRNARAPVRTGGAARSHSALRRVAKPKRQESLIDRDGRVAEHLRQPAHRHAAIQLHLPAAIARVQHAGGKPRVLGVARINRRARRARRSALRPAREGLAGRPGRPGWGGSCAPTTTR